MKAVDPIKIRLEASDISVSLMCKWDALLHELAAYPSAVVAYSGGVDSSFLAFSVAQALGDRMVAVTLDSTIEAPDTLQSACDFSAHQGFKHVVLPYDPLQNAVFCSNSIERCYICKTSMLDELWNFTRKENYQVVLEGQNDDDLRDFRPGSKAIEETGTLSPLARQGLTKAEIRQLSKALGLSVWNKPSSPCLATRIPYGMPITKSTLNRIAQAELYMREQGFQMVRVRCHNELARVEIDPSQMPMLLELRDDILDNFKKIGFIYVALDLQGYRLGSLNEGLSL